MRWFRFASLLGFGAAFAQTLALPNPYRVTETWFHVPAGRVWGSTAAVDIGPDGHIWIGERCGANSCAESSLAPVFEFDASGNMLRNFGAGMFVFPHGIHADREGNVWITDGRGGNGKGHQVIKFSPDGGVLLTLGKAGVAGDGPDTFNQPSDVVVAPNGDIFVADGHDANSNARIVKFSKDGKFLKTWGKRGSGPGELNTPHSLAMDSRGRLFVADRGNNRIQIFDQEGNFLGAWTQFSRPSGLYIDRNDVLYAADSESNTARHPGWRRGIYIGSARDGSVTALIPDATPDPDTTPTSSGEGVAAAPDGTVYSAEVGPKGDVKRYIRP
jgi:streptogramin lyase